MSGAMVKNVVTGAARKGRRTLLEQVAASPQRLPSFAPTPHPASVGKVAPAAPASAATAATTASAVRPAGKAKWNPVFGKSFSGGYGGVAGVGFGMMTGAATNYGQGDSMLSGAVLGAAGGWGASRLAGKAVFSRAASNIGWRGARGGMRRSWASTATRGALALESKSARAITFGAGAMLGAGMFSGGKSHARGFNANRGSRIGH